MVSVRVVERAADGVVEMVSMRHGGMAASRPVGLSAFHRRTDPRAAAVHLQAVLVGVPSVRGVEMPVVEVVLVVAVAHLAVPAARTVLVLVTVVRRTGHGCAPRAILPPQP